ncbi:putative ribosomal-protein-alanine acetyltransferase [Tissierellia bacterium KA00581]|nr:putative ribosomal-protein-alanine acetyltransferase [Tissierellia bacterium KA00581]
MKEIKTVRYAKDTDLLDILKLDRENFKSFYDKDFYLKKILDEKILIIEFNKEFVGFICFEFIFDQAEVYKFVIKKEHRKKKLGLLLMEYFINEMKDKGVLKIFLEVRVDNSSAISFYEKFNFKKLRKIKDYYTNPKVDGYAMLKEV